MVFVNYFKEKGIICGENLNNITYKLYIMLSNLSMVCKKMLKSVIEMYGLIGFYYASILFI